MKIPGVGAEVQMFVLPSARTNTCLLVFLVELPEASKLAAIDPHAQVFLAAFLLITSDDYYW